MCDNFFFNLLSKVGIYLVWNLNCFDKLVKSKILFFSGLNIGLEVLMILYLSSCLILKFFYLVGRRGELVSFCWWLVVWEFNVLFLRGVFLKYI